MGTWCVHAGEILRYSPGGSPANSRDGRAFTDRELMDHLPRTALRGHEHTRSRRRLLLPAADELHARECRRGVPGRRRCASGHAVRAHPAARLSLAGEGRAWLRLAPLRRGRCGLGAALLLEGGSFQRFGPLHRAAQLRPGARGHFQSALVLAPSAGVEWTGDRFSIGIAPRVDVLVGSVRTWAVSLPLTISWAGYP